MCTYTLIYVDRCTCAAIDFKAGEQVDMEEHGSIWCVLYTWLCTCVSGCKCVFGCTYVPRMCMCVYGSTGLAICVQEYRFEWSKVHYTVCTVKY